MLLDHMSNLKQRLLVSLVAVVILVFSIYFANEPIFKPIFTLITATIIFLALCEFYHIAYGKGYLPLTKLGLVFSLIFTFCNFTGINYSHLATLPSIAFWVFVICTFAYYFFQGADPLSNIAMTIFGFIYVAIPLNLVLNITYFFPNHSAQDGRWWLFYLILTTKITDVGAFFIGKKWGYTQMTPFISPKKSWEGAFAGLFSSVIASTLFVYFLHKVFSSPPIQLTYLQSFFISIAISLIGQFGDLAESLLKRDVGIKDSSHLPGLGGILDLVDSLIFTSPFLYFFLKILY